MKSFGLGLAILAVTLIGVFAQSPFNVHQLHALKRVSESVVSPKGDIAVYSVRSWDENTKKTKVQLEAVVINTTTTRKLTTSSLNAESSPTFSPDGETVAFQGDDDNTIYQVNVRTGATKPLVTLPVAVTSLKWSPSGKFIVFSAKVFVDCADLKCSADKFATIASREPNTGYEFTRLYVRHWDTYETEGAYFHLWVLPVAQKGDGTWGQAAGEYDLMKGMMAAGPVPPFGGSEQYDISPSGDEVAFTCETIEHDTAWKTGWKIYKTASGPGNTPVQISFGSARTQNPMYSPDGKVIAYLAMNRPGKESDTLHLNLYNRSTGLTNTPVLPWDRSIGVASWAGDNDSLFFSADEDARVKLFLYRISTNKITLLIENGHNGLAQYVSGTDLVIISRDSMNAPSDVWQFTFFRDSMSSLKQLTNYNQAALSSIWMSSPERFYFNSNGTSVQGWLLRPFGWDSSKKWPLAQLIHGGPEGAWDDAWSFRWNPQLWASAGYVTIAINPRGSSGFGQAYQDAVALDWGGQPYFDLMNGNDFITNKYSWVDSSRMCACGASYGGFMVNWIMGQTNRFKCLVTHDGVFDAMGMYYGSEEVFFNEDEFGPPPFSSETAHQMYERFSPVNYVKNWQTPTLVIHGGKDYRIPESQGLSVFTALQRKGIPSKLLMFPMENHWVLNSLNSIQWYDNVLGWLGQWTNTVAKEEEEPIKAPPMLPAPVAIASVAAPPPAAPHAIPAAPIRDTGIVHVNAELSAPLLGAPRTRERVPHHTSIAAPFTTDNINNEKPLIPRPFLRRQLPRVKPIG